MTTYWTTFRIHYATIGSRDSDTRRRALLSALYHTVTDGRAWEESTSFLLFNSDESLDSLAKSIGRAIDTRIDLVLIARADGRSARVIGDSTDDDLFAYLPNTQRAA